jgi:hypothetical protein
MAIYCDYCHKLFDTELTSCPDCSGRLSRDNQSDSDLIKAGYQLHSLRPKAAPQAHTTVSDPSIESDDLLSRLRADPYRETEDPTVEPTYEPSTTKGAKTASKAKSSKTPRAKTAQTVSKAATSSSANQDPLFVGQDIPTDQPEPEPARGRGRRSAPSYEDELEREQARLRRQIRRQRFWDGVANLPWLVLLRVALIAAVIAFLVFLWSMRYTILNAILEFFIELLPVVLVIAAIVYLIRSIFRP